MPKIALVVAVIVVIGGIFLFSKNSSNSPKTIQPQETKQEISSSSSIQWENYQDEKYGYMLKHPKSWIVENMPAENRRLIRVSDENKTAFVLIEGFAGSSLEKEGELEKVMKFLEDEIKKNKNMKLADFKTTSGDNSSSYVALGEETYNDKTVEFEEKMTVWKNGRSVRTHAAYAPDTRDTNKPITLEIINSFKTD